jgi:hypothetical protein
MSSPSEFIDDGRRKNRKEKTLGEAKTQKN